VAKDSALWTAKGEGRKLIEDLDELYERAKKARQPHEPQWLINLAFYLNKQWVLWNPASSRLIRPVVPSWRVMLTVNRVRSIVRTEYAKLTKQRPTIGVQPARSDPDAEAQAKGNEKILEYLWRPSGSDRATKSTLLWALITGTGFLKNYWDKFYGPVMTESGEHLGEVSVDGCSPFETYWDPLGEDVEDMQWCFHVKVRSGAYVLEKFDVEMDEQTINGEDTLEGRLGALEEKGYGNLSGILVKEFWERSSRKHPNGRYVVYAEDKVLYAGDNPYPKVQIPFIRVRHLPIPGKFYGDSVVTDLVDIQREYNKTYSQAVESKNLNLRPGLLAVRNQVRTPFTSQPGVLVEYDLIPGAPKPEPIVGKETPATFWRLLDRIEKDFMEVSGQHEVTHAQTGASGAKSGIAIAYLQEQDDTRLGPTSQDYEDAMERLETNKLRLGRQFYLEPRVGRIIGEDNTVEVFQFSREDIPEDVDVRVQAGSSLPQSRVARQEFIINLWHEKLIRDPRVALKMLEFGDVEGLYEDLEADMAQAERENETMQQLRVVVVEDWHNHPVHFGEHTRFMKSQEYERLPPDAQTLFRAHIAQHRQFEAADLMAAENAQGQPRQGAGFGAAVRSARPVPAIGGALGELEASLGLGGPVPGAQAPPGRATGGPGP